MRKIRLKRVISLFMLVLMMITQTVSFLPDKVSAAQTGVDRTCDTAEVGKNLTLTVNMGSERREFKLKDNDTQIDMSGIAPDTITGVDFKLDFSVLKPSYGANVRSLKGGDYISYDFASAGFILPNVESKEIVSASNEVIGTYSIKDGVFTMVFSDVVNAENSNDNIGGNVSFRANVDLDKCNSEHESKYNLYGDGASQTAEIIFGKMTSEISGVDVTGKFNPEDTTVVWTISAGTNNKGTNLNGADLDVSFDSGKLKYKEAYIMVGGEKVPVELPGSNGKYTYRVTDSVKDGLTNVSVDTSAPFKLYVVTNVDALDSDFNSGADAVAERELTCELKQGEMKLGVDPTNASNSSKAVVTLNRPHIAKSGEQVNGNEMLWTLKINDTTPKYVLLDSSITDEFTGMDFVSGSFNVDGKNIKEGSSELGDLSVKKDGDATKLVYKWPGSGRIDKEIIITYKTKIDTTGNYADKEVKNKVYLNGSWPTGGSGTGEPVNYGMPPVTEEFQYVFLSEKAKVISNGTKDKGIVEWTIKPSSRDDSWNEAEIVTSNGEGQKVIAGSDKYGITVSYDSKEYTESELIEKGYLVRNADETLTFNLPHSEFENLGKVVIKYYTVVPEFYQSNGTEVTANGNSTLTLKTDASANDAKLSVSQSAKAVLTNDMLSIKGKRYYEKDSLKPEIKYTVTVNKNGIKVDKDTEVVEDLENLVSNLIQGDQVTPIGADEWKLIPDSISVDGSTDVEAKVDGKNIVVKYLKDSSDTFSVSYRIALTDEAEQKYLLHSDKGGVGGIIQTEVTSKIEGVSSTTGETKCVINATAKNEVSQENPLVDNSFLKKSSKATETGADWRIEINPNGTKLSGAQIIDVISKDLQLDYGSVKLYKATHKEGELGLTETEEVPFVKNGVPGKDIEPSDVGSLELHVSLPDGNDAYVLTYSTRLTKGVAKVSNTAKFKNGSNEESHANVCEFSDAAAGFLTKVAHFKVVKKDSISKKPIKNVLFGLYSIDAGEKKMVSGPAFSDENGCVTFYGVTVGTKKLYVREMKGVDDYETVDEDANVYFIGDATEKGLHDLTTSNGTILNSRKKVGTFEFTKTYQNADAEKAANFKSEFKLFIIGEAGREVPVYATEETDGSFKYAQGMTEKLPTSVGVIDTTLAEADAKNTFSVIGQSNLKFTNLPWGDYVLRETTTKSGYSLANDVKFTVDKDGTVTANEPITNVDGAYTLENKQITMHLVKEAENGISLDGCELAVYKTEADAKSGSDENIVLDPRDNSTKLMFKANSSEGEFKDIDALESRAEFVVPELPGPTDGATSVTYYIGEKTAPTDSRLALVRPVPVTVNLKGDITYDTPAKKIGDDRSIVLKDRVVTAKVLKRDQFDAAVSGATIELQEFKDDSYETIDSFETTTAAKTIELRREGKYRLVETALPAGYVSASHSDMDGEYTKVEFKTDKYGTITVSDLGNNTAIKNTTDTYLKKLLNSYTNGTFVLKNEKIIGQAGFIKYSNQKDASGKNEAFKHAKATFDLYACDDMEKSNARPVVYADKNVSIETDSEGRVSTGAVSGLKLEQGYYFFRETTTESDYVLGSDVDTDVFEVNASNRYTYDSKGMLTKEIEVTKNGGKVVNDCIAAFVVVEKVDQDDNPIPGVTFKLSGAGDDLTQKTYSEAKTVSGAETNGSMLSVSAKKGEAVFANLHVGTYTLTETIPTDGFKRDTTVHTVTVSQDGAVTLDGESIPLKDGKRIARLKVVNEKNSFTVTKDREEGATNSLKGTRFAVYDTKDMTRPLKELSVSDDTESGRVIRFSGVIVPVSNPMKDIEHTYLVKEVVPADGYTLSAEMYVRMNFEGELFASLDNENYQKVEGNNLLVVNKLNAFSVSMNDRETKAKLTNPADDWKLTITPKDGSKFSDGSKTSKAITDTKNDFKGILVPGSEYELKEINVPTGYIRFKDVATVSVNNNGVISVKGDSDRFSVTDNHIEVLNEKNSLSIVKTGVPGHSVNGTGFKLTPVVGTFADGSANPVSFEMVESDNGVSGISEIYNGFKGMLKTDAVYELEEVVAADSYVAGDNLFIKIDEEGIISVSSKVDDDFSEALYAVNGRGKNIIEVKNSMNSLEFITFVNAYEYGKETDEPYAILPNATFTLYSSYEDGVLKNPVKCKSTNEKGEVVSDKDGKISITGLKAGTYYITQTEVPVYDEEVNRVIAKETDEDTLVAVFTVSENGKVSPMKSVDGKNEFQNYLNDTVRASFSMTKVDALNNSKVLPDSTYVLYRKAKDSTVADSYANNNTVTEYRRLLSNRTSGVRVNRVFTNKLAVSGLPNGIAPVSILGKDTVDFDEADYTEVMKVKTDKDGNIKLDGLLTGYDYVLKEVEAPSGSQVSAEPISFTFDIDKDGVIKTSLISGKGTVAKTDGHANLNVLWMEPPTVISVSKTNATGMALKGATLRILDEKGHVVVKDFVTDGKPHDIMGVLEAGKTYTLVEVKAPEGYKIASPIKFTVKEQSIGSSEVDIENAKTKIVMVDELKPVSPAGKAGNGAGGVGGFISRLIKAPKTGDISSYIVFIILLLTMISSGVGICITVRKKDL